MGCLCDKASKGDYENLEEPLVKDIKVNGIF